MNEPSTSSCFGVHWVQHATTSLQRSLACGRPEPRDFSELPFGVRAALQGGMLDGFGVALVAPVASDAADARHCLRHFATPPPPSPHRWRRCRCSCYNCTPATLAAALTSLAAAFVVLHGNACICVSPIDQTFRQSWPITMSAQPTQLPHAACNMEHSKK